MNSNLYKQVHKLAVDLLKAAEKDDGDVFTTHYESLKALCYEHEDEERKNHAVQWETLADFTEDTEEALHYYEKGLGYAEDIKAFDYIASINYAIALLQQENSNEKLALAAIQQANEAASKISDSELQREIKNLLKDLG